MKRASKIKRLLSLTLAMACLFAVVAIPQVSAETADNPFVYVPAPNGGYVLSEVAAGEAAPRAALLSYYGIFIMTINLRAAPCPLPFPRNPWRS